MTGYAPCVMIVRRNGKDFCSECIAAWACCSTDQNCLLCSYRLATAAARPPGQHSTKGTKAPEEREGPDVRFMFKIINMI